MKSYQATRHGPAMAVLLALLCSSPSLTMAFDRGRALYENHCRSCHEDGLHARDPRVIDSIASLRGRVSSWSLHSGLGWGDDEIDDVTAYLNRRFYQLTR